MRNGVQLITYADRLGGRGLTGIRELLTGPLDGVFSGVHVLPFFLPYDGADAGFDPIDHAVVDPRLGDWDDVRAIAQTHDVMVDLIVNHISDRSPQFTDFAANGDTSQYAGMFLEYGSVFPNGAAADELLAIYRPRPGLPFSVVPMLDGTRRIMWTTFTPHQIDLNTDHPAARQYLRHVLTQFAGSGVRQVRLDAVGYAVKTRGTTSFMTPETHRLIKELDTELHQLGMESLPEIHSHYSAQQQAADLADRVYDFALPPLVLHALYSGSAGPLRRWLTMSPRNAVTVLDTHDGIGVIDVGPSPTEPGLLGSGQIDQLVDGIHAASHGESRLATGAAASNLDLYQVNCTYYSALGCDDDRYLLARLIQFLCPGVPQIYYAGLLASPNDTALLAETDVGRDINRPYYTTAEIEEQLARPVVRRLLGLARFRNTHPAFAGTFRLGEGHDRELRIEWTAPGAAITVRIDVAAAEFTLRSSIGPTEQTIDTWDGFAT